jgi:hypothetical protein
MSKFSEGVFDNPDRLRAEHAAQVGPIVSMDEFASALIKRKYTDINSLIFDWITHILQN